jgi:hypothetical protein
MKFISPEIEFRQDNSCQVSSVLKTHLNTPYFCAAKMIMYVVNEPRDCMQTKLILSSRFGLYNP